MGVNSLSLIILQWRCNSQSQVVRNARGETPGSAPWLLSLVHSCFLIIIDRRSQKTPQNPDASQGTLGCTHKVTVVSTGSSHNECLLARCALGISADYKGTIARGLFLRLPHVSIPQTRLWGTFFFFPPKIRGKNSKQTLLFPFVLYEKCPVLLSFSASAFVQIKKNIDRKHFNSGR